jgi:hypothetical protein
MKQMEEAIEEIRRLMLRSGEEVVSKEKLERKEPAQVGGKMKMQKQQQQ